MRYIPENLRCLSLIVAAWLACSVITSSAAETQQAKRSSRTTSTLSRTPAKLAANEQTSVQRTMWLISTRHMPGNPCCDPVPRDQISFRYWINEVGGKWTASDEATFLKSQGPIAMVVPGAPATLDETKALGKQIYGRYRVHLPDENSLRFVIWTWPSDQWQRRQLRDFREKAWTAEAQGYYLAHFIDTQAADAPIGISGYSLGARVTTASLHLLGGGTIPCCNNFVASRSKKIKVRALLTAGAIDNWWLCENGRYCKALPYADRIQNVYNPCDSILKRYHFIYGLRRGPSAIGYTGMSLDCLGPAGSKFEQVNLSNLIGSTHDPSAYIATPAYFALTASTVLIPEPKSNKEFP